MVFSKDILIFRDMNNEQILPCEPDNNGECLICDCWVSDCAYQRYLNKDYSIETKEELEKMFEGYDKRTSKRSTDRTIRTTNNGFNPNV